ncbi:MAG: hypothetical protein MJY99_11880 [Fibrobacter sp.]|nr:hypothetical protein [Fibrobacter sp.]
MKTRTKCYAGIGNRDLTGAMDGCHGLPIQKVMHHLAVELEKLGYTLGTAPARTYTLQNYILSLDLPKSADTPKSFDSHVLAMTNVFPSYQDESQSPIKEEDIIRLDDIPIDIVPINDRSVIKEFFPMTVNAIDFSKKDSTYKFYILYYYSILPFDVVLSNISKNHIEIVEINNETSNDMNGAVAFLIKDNEGLFEELEKIDADIKEISSDHLTSPEGEMYKGE